MRAGSRGRAGLPRGGAAGLGRTALGAGQAWPPCAFHGQLCVSRSLSPLGEALLFSEEIVPSQGVVLLLPSLPFLACRQGVITGLLWLVVGQRGSLSDQKAVVALPSAAPPPAPLLWLFHGRPFWLWDR